MAIVIMIIMIMIIIIIIIIIISKSLVRKTTSLFKCFGEKDYITIQVSTSIHGPH